MASRPVRRRWTTGLRVAALVAMVAGGPAAALAASAEDPCIATYDRHGTVTGRYCPDGSTKPPPAGPRKATRAPDAVDPEQTVPADERAASAAGRKAAPGRAAPKGGEIMCGQWKTSGKGCRGIFTILR